MARIRYIELYLKKKTACPLDLWADGLGWALAGRGT